MNTLSGKKLLVGITGGIAAYKAAEVVRRLKELNTDVQVVMTKAAQEFITPLTLQAVSGNPVRTHLFDSAAEAAMGHIELARWADAILIVPASADFIAHLAHGFASDLLSTLCLATTAPIIVVPAMNQQMWLNRITQKNILFLRQQGIHFFGPADGGQACGEFGPGRMMEPAEITKFLISLLTPKILTGKKIVITAGPTREYLDPVRYLTNRSSGKMGFALAQAASESGAEVTLITGPVNLPTPYQVKRIDIESAAEMFTMVKKQIDGCDIFIGAAAVADYQCKNIATQKIKKTSDELKLSLTKNPDILAHVAKQKKHPFTVGFSAETENLIAHAKQKLSAKKLDLVIANSVTGSDTGFDSDYNQCIALWNKGQQEFARSLKSELAIKLILLIAKLSK